MKLTFILWLIVTNFFTFFMCYFTQHLFNGNDRAYYVRVTNDAEASKLEGIGLRELNEHSYNVPAEVIHGIHPHQQYISSPSTPRLSSANASSLDTVQLISCANSNSSTPLYLSTTIVAITPTYKRLTQKSDLVSLCQTVMHVPNFLWIVIEDSVTKSALVERVVHHCYINSIHLNVGTSKESKKAEQRGVEQRNAGLQWARRYCKDKCGNNCSGVIYFMDDDNKYDLRLFEQMRRTKSMSVFPVAFSGGLAFEGPICDNGKAVDWQAVWQSKERHIPVDMAAFAIHISLFIQKPEVMVGFRPGQKRRSKRGFMESDLIKSIGRSREQVECRGIPNEVLVWHVKTTKPYLSYKSKYKNVEV